MYKLLRVALLAAPLAGGAAWAQESGTGGPTAPGTVTRPPATSDTRTPLQRKAGRIDQVPDRAPPPPRDVPEQAPESDTTGLPSRPPEGSLKRRTDVDHPRGYEDSSRTNDRDLMRDQLDSDK